MTPSCGGMVRATGLDAHPNEFISVTAEVLTPTTTVVIRNTLGGDSWAQTQIVLDEEGRRELIELLGGTP